MMNDDNGSDVSMKDANGRSRSDSSSTRNDERGEHGDDVLGHDLLVLQDHGEKADDPNGDDESASMRLTLTRNGENWLHIRALPRFRDDVDGKAAASAASRRSSPNSSREDEKKEDHLASPWEKDVENTNQAKSTSTEVLQTQEPSPTQNTLTQVQPILQTQEQTPTQFQIQTETQETVTQQSMPLLAYLNQPSQDDNEVAKTIGELRSPIEILSGDELSVLCSLSKISASASSHLPPSAPAFLCFEEVSIPGATCQNNYVTIKDMRPPRHYSGMQSSVARDEGGVVTEIDLSRATNRNGSVGWKDLPRRRLTVLCPGDRIRITVSPSQALRSAVSSDRDDKVLANSTIVLEYRNTKTSTKERPTPSLSSITEKKNSTLKDTKETDGNIDIDCNDERKNSESHATTSNDRASNSGEKHLNTFCGTTKKGALEKMQQGRNGMQPQGIRSDPRDFHKPFDGTESVIDSNSSVAVDSTVNSLQESLRPSRFKLLVRSLNASGDVQGDQTKLQNISVAKGSYLRKESDPYDGRESCGNVQNSPTKIKEGNDCKADNISIADHNNQESEHTSGEKNSGEKNIVGGHHEDKIVAASIPNCWSQQTTDPTVDKKLQDEHESDDSSGATVPLCFTQDTDYSVADNNIEEQSKKDQGDQKMISGCNAKVGDNLVSHSRKQHAEDTKEIPRNIEIQDGDHEGDRPPVSQLLLSMESDNEGEGGGDNNDSDDSSDDGYESPSSEADIERRKKRASEQLFAYVPQKFCRQSDSSKRPSPSSNSKSSKKCMTIEGRLLRFERRRQARLQQQKAKRSYTSESSDDDSDFEVLGSCLGKMKSKENEKRNIDSSKRPSPSSNSKSSLKSKTIEGKLPRFERRKQARLQQQKAKRSNSVESSDDDSDFEVFGNGLSKMKSKENEKRNIESKKNDTAVAKRRVGTEDESQLEHDVQERKNVPPASNGLHVCNSNTKRSLNKASVSRTEEKTSVKSSILNEARHVEKSQLKISNTKDASCVIHLDTSESEDQNMVVVRVAKETGLDKIDDESDDETASDISVTMQQTGKSRVTRQTETGILEDQNGCHGGEKATSLAVVEEIDQSKMALRSRGKRKSHASNATMDVAHNGKPVLSITDSVFPEGRSSNLRLTRSNQGTTGGASPAAPSSNKRRRTLTSDDASKSDSIAETAANKLYEKRFKTAIQSNLIKIVVSGFQPNEMSPITKLCKKLSKMIQLKVYENIDHNTTACILPTASNDNEEASCRTLKAIRCALLGVPIVSLAWLEQCEREGKIMIPTTYIRTLSSTTGTSTLRDHARYGVARLAAARSEDSEYPTLPFQNTFVFLAGKYSSDKKNGITKLIEDGFANLVKSPREASAKLKFVMNSADELSSPPKTFVLLFGDRGKSIPKYLEKEIIAAMEAALEGSQSRKIFVVDYTWASLSIACAKLLPPDDFKPKDSEDLWWLSKELPE